MTASPERKSLQYLRHIWIRAHTNAKVYTVKEQTGRIQNDSCEYAFACGRLQFELCCWLLISIVAVIAVSVVAAAATIAKMLENPKTYFTWANVLNFNYYVLAHKYVLMQKRAVCSTSYSVLCMYEPLRRRGVR